MGRKPKKMRMEQIRLRIPINLAETLREDLGAINEGVAKLCNLYLETTRAVQRFFEDQNEIFSAITGIVLARPAVPVRFCVEEDLFEKRGVDLPVALAPLSFAGTLAIESAVNNDRSLRPANNIGNLYAVWGRRVAAQLTYGKSCACVLGDFCQEWSGGGTRRDSSTSNHFIEGCEIAFIAGLTSQVPSYVEVQGFHIREDYHLLFDRNDPQPYRQAWRALLTFLTIADRGEVKWIFPECRWVRPDGSEFDFEVVLRQGLVLPGNLTEIQRDYEAKLSAARARALEKIIPVEQQMQSLSEKAVPQGLEQEAAAVLDITRQKGELAGKISDVDFRFGRKQKELQKEYRLKAAQLLQRPDK